MPELFMGIKSIDEPIDIAFFKPPIPSWRNPVGYYPALFRPASQSVGVDMQQIGYFFYGHHLIDCIESNHIVI
jgi:hypothetical protein